MSDLRERLSKIIQPQTGYDDELDFDSDKNQIWNDIRLTHRQKAFARYLAQKIDLQAAEKAPFIRAYKRSVFLLQECNFDHMKEGNQFLDIAKSLDDIGVELKRWNNMMFQPSDTFLLQQIQEECAIYLREHYHSGSSQISFAVRSVAQEIYNFWEHDLGRDTKHYNRYYDKKKHANSDFKEIINLIQNALKAEYGLNKGLDRAINLLNKADKQKQS